MHIIHIDAVRRVRVIIFIKADTHTHKHETHEQIQLRDDN